jgi:adenine-specific DNA methylase
MAQDPGMTIPKECKRLAEVDFPIAEVSKHAVREKSIRHGHPSTLHLWWARRPLASSRAMLMALLLPDPVDEACPPLFRQEARRVLLAMKGRPSGWNELLADNLGLRRGLLRFIADFANWDNAANPIYLETARALVRAAHPDETPLVVDPFAGGGSIPLEALRVGADAFASDLNPVAVLINKVMLEDIPRYGKAKIKVKNAEGVEVEADGLAEALRIAGAAVKAAAEQELAEFYPPDPDGARPIAYIWARTIRCESPNCGAEIPLVRSFWLSKKTSRKQSLRYIVHKQKGQIPYLTWEIFEPANDSAVPSHTVSRAKATCPCCGVVLSPDRVRFQLADQKGGADVIFSETGERIGGALLLAVATLRPDTQGRQYRLPTDLDYEVVWKAQQRIGEIGKETLVNGYSFIPNEPTPVGGGSGAGRAFSLQKYGMMKWGDLFFARQQLALATFAKCIANSESMKMPLVLALGKLVDLANAECRWEPKAECPRNVFGAGRVKPSWDFAEGVPTSDSSGGFGTCLDNLINGIQSVRGIDFPASVETAPAQNSPLLDESCHVWFTDPPYYDAYPYADLSDAFFVWFKRALPENRLLSDPFDSSNPLTPKNLEAVQDESRSVNGSPKNAKYFERAITDAFSEGIRTLRPEGIGCIVFAHKTTEGWEALIGGMISAGMAVVASWPLATEQGHRLRAKESAALETSIHLVCKPRGTNVNIGDWSTVLRALPSQVFDWMTRLESEGIRGADLVFACIGPALEIYSQYSQVVDAEDRPIPLGGDPTATDPHKRGYLAYVWETVARLALEQILGSSNGGSSVADALEEDARLTALFLWTQQATDSDTGLSLDDTADDEESDDPGEEDEDDPAPRAGRKGGLSLPFDVVRRFAQPLGIHLPAWEDRIISTQKGVVRLLPIGDRAHQLFGIEGAEAVAVELERGARNARDMQLSLFAQSDLPTPKPKGGRRKVNVADADLQARQDATTLDRVHAAMLLQKSGRTNALRALLAAEQEQGATFLRLANALSGLYPRESEEKRLVDAMLLAYPK